MNQELGPCEQLGRPGFELLYQILSRTKNKTRGGFSMIRNGREVSGKGAGSIQVLMRSAGLVPGVSQEARRSALRGLDRLGSGRLDCRIPRVYVSK